jgi:serine/threonine-protein kinase
MCEAEQGDVLDIAARGYHCTACDRWPNSTWWHRAGAQRGMEVDVGEVVDRFRIGDCLDEDDASVWFDARDGDQPVVVRVFRAWVGSDREASGRLQRIAGLVTAAPHPNVVAPIAVGVSRGHSYVATRPYAGTPLQALLGAPIAPARVVAVLAQLCRALHVIHAAGFVCRRLPANAYVDIDDAVTVDLLETTFPRAQARNAGLELNVARIISPGPIAYFSPEQLMGKPLDGRSDLYALGVIGYQLVSGRLPFPDAKGPAALITAQLKQAVPALSVLVPGTPRQLEDAIRVCLEKDRTKRPGDVGELAAMLER